ncbi:MAG: UDP-2,3-diacylglucosamine diphosphatase LpxI [Nitrospirae bacterium]|nr:UDP-2,3-diacylglucosamine diphosphatase LpxI [Nitrospirota bacterium]
MVRGKRRIGLIAGNGRFPIIFADTARQQGLAVYAVAHRDETLPELAEHVDGIAWVRVGQLGKLIEALKAGGVREAALAGGIRKTRLFEGAFPDRRALGLMLRLKHRKDDQILRAVAGEIEREGIRIRPCTLFLDPLLAGEGVLAGPPLSADEEEDIRLGFQTAKAIGELDVGQCVVIKGGVVLAVEAVEGTDGAIRRGGELGGPGVVVVKVSKPQQDLRFDVPTVGIQTLKTLHQVRGRALALETGKTLLLDKEALLREASRTGITVVGVVSAK